MIAYNEERKRQNLCPLRSPVPHYNCTVHHGPTALWLTLTEIFHGDLNHDPTTRLTARHN